MVRSCLALATAGLWQEFQDSYQHAEADVCAAIFASSIIANLAHSTGRHSKGEEP
jgi:hypothetical protein